MRLARREIEGRAGTLAFRTIAKWLSGKDLVRAEAIGERLGRAVFRFGKKRRERAMSNLALAFPEWSSERRLEVTKGVFEHFGRVMCDFVRTENRKHEEVLDSITYEGVENMDAALAEGKGVIFITGHFGNWERMAQWITLKGYKMSVVVRDANNRELNEMVLNLRRAAGLDVISRGNAARGILTRLKKNEVVGILPDQNSDEVFIPFFGKPCGTVLGPAVLALRSGAKLVPGYCYRTGPGKYQIRMFPAIEPEPGCEDEAEALMRSINLSLENNIREHPDQYLWIHDRWKAARRRGLV